MATTADSALVTGLLKAFFSHEGRVVAKLEQNVEEKLANPVCGVFPLAGEKVAAPGRAFSTRGGDKGVATTTIRISAGGGARIEIEEPSVQHPMRGEGMGG